MTIRQTGLLSVTDEQYEKMESLNFKVGNVCSAAHSIDVY